jgi:hypothetical protein
MCVDLMEAEFGPMGSPQARAKLAAIEAEIAMSKGGPTAPSAASTPAQGIAPAPQ